MNKSHLLLVLCAMFVQGCLSQGSKQDLSSHNGQTTAGSKKETIRFFLITQARHEGASLSTVGTGTYSPLRGRRAMTYPAPVFLSKASLSSATTPIKLQSNQLIDSAQSVRFPKHSRLLGPNEPAPSCIRFFSSNLKACDLEEALLLPSTKSFPDNLDYPGYYWGPLWFDPRRSSYRMHVEQPGYVKPKGDGFSGVDVITLLTAIVVVSILCWVISVVFAAFVEQTKQLRVDFLDACKSVFGGIFIGTFLCIFILICLVICCIALLAAVILAPCSYVHDAWKRRCALKQARYDADLAEEIARKAEADARAELVRRQLESDKKERLIADQLVRNRAKTQNWRERNEQELLARRLAVDLVNLDAEENLACAKEHRTRVELAISSAERVEAEQAKYDLNDGDINMNNSLGG